MEKFSPVKRWAALRLEPGKHSARLRWGGGDGKKSRVVQSVGQRRFERRMARSGSRGEEGVSGRRKKATRPTPVGLSTGAIACAGPRPDAWPDRRLGRRRRAPRAWSNGGAKGQGLRKTKGQHRRLGSRRDSSPVCGRHNACSTSASRLSPAARRKCRAPVRFWRKAPGRLRFAKRSKRYPRCPICWCRASREAASLAEGVCAAARCAR